MVGSLRSRVFRRDGALRKARYGQGVRHVPRGTIEREWPASFTERSPARLQPGECPNDWPPLAYDAVRRTHGWVAGRYGRIRRLI